MTEASTPETHLPPHSKIPRPMSPAFFVWIGVCVLFLAAAIVVGFFGPKIWPKAKPHAQPPAVAASEASPAQLRAQVAELQQELEDAKRASAAAAAASPGLPIATAQALSARIDRLEASQRRSERAASAAIAAAALADAAQTSRPFTGELAALERLMPDNSLVSDLRPLAETGAPTRSALTAEFPDVAARAASAAHAPGKNANFLSRALAALGSLITLRRVDDLTGASADAILARAERRISDGDIEGALEQLRALPPSAQAATADWRERARRRVEIETRIARLRTVALRDLAAYAPPPEAAPQAGGAR
jgi:hypothetical protein